MTAREIPADELACVGCVTATDVGMPEYEPNIVHQHPECPVHGIHVMVERARKVRDGTVTNGAPWQQNAEIARYILGEA